MRFWTVRFGRTGSVSPKRSRRFGRSPVGDIVSGGICRMDSLRQHSMRCRLRRDRIGFHHGRSSPPVNRLYGAVRVRLECGSPRGGIPTNGGGVSSIAGTSVGGRAFARRRRSRPNRLGLDRTRRVARLAARVDRTRNVSRRRCSRSSRLDEHRDRQQSRTRSDRTTTDLFQRVRQRSLVLHPGRSGTSHCVASGSDRSPSITVGNCNSTRSSSRSRRFTHRLLSRLRSGASAANSSNCGTGAPTFSASAE